MGKPAQFVSHKWSKAATISFVVALFVSVPALITLAMAIAFTVLRAMTEREAQSSGGIGYQLIFLALILNIPGILAWAVFAAIRLTTTVVEMDSVRE